VTAFFVPGAPPGDQTERAYEDLRRHAEITSGRPPRSRRIYKLICRRGGSDCETCVGEHDPVGDGTVHAIFEIGDAYAVYARGGCQSISKRQTYTVIEFE
jgi:hypothetical protein